MLDLSRRIGSPRVVAVSEIGTTPDGATFTRSPRAGESLAALLARGAENDVPSLDPTRATLSPDRAIALVSDMLRALADGHATGSIHRDVRPGAIFVDGATTVLASFGLPVPEHGWDASDEAIRFWSPEQAMGLVDQLDVRADLFSAGAVLRRVLTGRDLWHGLPRIEAMIAAATRPVPPVASLGLAIAPALAHVVDRALAWDRRERYENADAMREALHAAHRG